MEDNPLMAIQLALSNCERAQIRGDGAGRFLFLEHNGRAAEASENCGAIWVELWDRNPNEDAPPVSEHTFQSAGDCIDFIRTWLFS